MLDSVDTRHVDLKLDGPIYTERFEVYEQGINNDTIFDNDTYSFTGNGTLDGMEIVATGSVTTNLRDDGTGSVIGRDLFVSQNGSANYSLKDISSIIDNTTQRLGAAFFDTNATGNLEFLKSTVVGVPIIRQRGRQKRNIRNVEAEEFAR